MFRKVILIAPLGLALTLAGCATQTTETSASTPIATATEAPLIETPAPSPVSFADVYADYPVPANATPDAAIAWEALMSPEGEYAAAASYLAVINTFGPVEPYATIYRQELNHADALIRQLDRYGIVAPSNPYEAVAVAPADLQTAANAWATGEIENIAMYDRLIAASTDSRLTGVLENLRSASLDNHLPLFEQAAANGGTL